MIPHVTTEAPPRTSATGHLAVRTDKHAIAPQGIDDGLAGGTGGCVINPGAEDVRNLLSRFGDQRLKAGDVLRVERPRGGGVGAAFERSPGDVLDDVRPGYLSVERARSDYGVTVRAEGGGEVTVDPDALDIYAANRTVVRVSPSLT